MSEFDWSRFTVRINVNASVDALYNAWATRQGIESWFLRRCDFVDSAGAALQSDQSVKVGDRYTWRWHGYPDSTKEEGEILEANGSNRFAFTFGKAGNCKVSITREGDESIVKLEQDNIPTDESGKQIFHIGCKGGWTFYLANLKSIYEGGIDLRNRKEVKEEMINS